MRHCHRFILVLVAAGIFLASTRAPGAAAANVNAADQGVMRIEPSRNLCPTPELRLPVDAASSVVLRPEMFGKWEEVFQRHPAALDYLLTPGDYTRWGPLRLANRSGSPNRKRTIRYYEPGTDPLHPLKRTREARIDTIDGWGPASHWVLHGLTIRKPSRAASFGGGASHFVLDSMLIEESHGYGIRLRSTKYVCVQNTVIRNAPMVAKQDSTGIQVKPDHGPVVGTRILDNEIYNYGDSIQITAAKDPWVPVEDTLIENNDLYLTDERRKPDGTACAENGIDIKAGADNSSTRLIGNRIWGFRRTDTSCAGTGSAGHAIVLHLAARNVSIEKNVIGEVPAGISEKIFPAGWTTDASRRVTVNGNYFYNIRKFHPLDLGAAFDLAGDVRVESNVIAQGNFMCDKGPKGGFKLGGPRFSGNMRIAVAVRDAEAIDKFPCPFDEAANPTKHENEARSFVYERKRWTGPELHSVKGGH